MQGATRASPSIPSKLCWHLEKQSYSIETHHEFSTKRNAMHPRVSLQEAKCPRCGVACSSVRDERNCGRWRFKQSDTNALRCGKRHKIQAPISSVYFLQFICTFRKLLWICSTSCAQ